MTRNQEYSVSCLDDEVHTEWNEFLSTTSGGHHVQSTLWGRVKALHGWESPRVVAKQDGVIVGGAQMLVRGFTGIGSLGYVPKGPVLALDEPRLATLLVTAMQNLARQRGVRYLVMQPPDGSTSLVEAMRTLGFRATALAVTTEATAIVDLRPDLGALLERMRKQARRDIRHGLASGMTAREGDESDLATFFGLLGHTGRRQGFVPHSPEFLTELWNVYRPANAAHLFLAEYDGEVVSAQMVIAFGDTVLAKASGWSGRHGRMAPNHVLEWVTMQWAKREGYERYDLEGIDPSIARSRLEGQPVGARAHAEHGPTFYKLGFGADIVLSPAAHWWAPNRILRDGFAALSPRVARLGVTRRFANRLKVT